MSSRDDAERPLGSTADLVTPHRGAPNDGTCHDGFPNHWDFYISCAADDQSWAEWITWHLEGAGASVLSPQSFVPGTNRLSLLRAGVRNADRTIALVSAAYLNEPLEATVWQAALQEDPGGFTRKLVPIRIEDIPLPDVLAQFVAIHLFDCPEQTAIERVAELTGSVTTGRTRPAGSPTYPGSEDPSPDLTSGGTRSPTSPTPPHPPVAPVGRPGTRRRWALISATATLIVGLTAATLAEISSDSGQHRDPTRTEFRAQDSVITMAISDDSRRLATGGLDADVRLWDLSDPDHPQQAGSVSVTRREALRTLALAPDGQSLVTVERDGAVKLWDVTNWADWRYTQPAARLDDQLSKITAVAFSPDGSQLATADDQGRLLLWDMTSWLAGNHSRPPHSRPITGNHGSARALAFSSDGRALAMSTSDHIFLFDPASPGIPRKQFTLHPGSGVDVAVSRGGELLAAAGGDAKTFTVWDTRDVWDTGPLINPLAERTDSTHTDSVNSVSFSPDGDTLASGSQDKSVIIWKIDGSRHLIDPLRLPQDDPVTTVAFSSGTGQVLAVAAGDRIVLWRLH